MELLLIAEVARRSGVCTKTVRLYANQGLIKPLLDNSGRRLFSPDDIAVVQRTYEANMTKRPRKRIAA